MADSTLNIAITADASGLSDAFEDAGDQVGQFASAVNEAGESTSESLGRLFGATTAATQGFVRLAQSAASGSFAEIPGIVGDIAGAMEGLSLASAGIVGVVAAVAGGLGYLAYQSIESAEKTEQLSNAFAMTGRGAGNSADAIAGEIEQLEELPGATQSAAEALVEFDATHADIDARLADTANQLLPQFSRAWKDPEKQIDNLKQVLSDMESGSLAGAAAKFDALNKSLLDLAPAEADFIGKMIESGNVTGAVTRILSDLAARGGDGVRSLNARIADVSGQLSEAKDRFDDLKSHIAYSREDLAAFASATGFAAAQVARLEGELSRLQGIKAAPISVPALDTSRIQEDLHKIENDTSLTDAQILSKQVGYLNNVLSHEHLTAAARVEIAQQLSDKQANLARDTGQKEIDAARQSAAEQSRAGESGVAGEIAADRKLLADNKITAQQRADVAKDLANKEIELGRQVGQRGAEAARKAAEEAKQAAAQQAEASRSAAQTDIEVLKLNLDAEKDSLEQQVEAHQVTSARKFEILKEDMQHVHDAAEAELDDELADANLGLSQFQAILDRKNILNAQSKLEMDNLARQQTKDVEVENQKQLQSWKDVVDEIASAEQQLVSDVFSGRKSLAQDLQQLGLKLLENEIANDLKYYTTRELYNLLGLKSDEMTEKGGILAHYLAEQEKTVATATQQTAQTDAVAAGVTTRQTIETTAQTTGMAQSAAAGSVTIMNDAYEAAAATYKSVSGIPVVGPILAPAAAAAAFGAVAAFDQMASLDVGAWDIPGDMTARIHAGEMVVPENFAAGLRGAVTGGGNSMTSSANHTWNVSALDARSFGQMLRTPAIRREMNKFTQEQVRKFSLTAP